MARGARVAELILMGVFVARGAILVEPPKNSACQDLALPRFVALGTFDLCVATGQLKLHISIVVKGQSLSTPGAGRVACGAGVAVLTLMGVFVARGANLVEPPKNSARQDLAVPRFVALGAFDLCVVSYKRKL